MNRVHTATMAAEIRSAAAGRSSYSQPVHTVYTPAGEGIDAALPARWVARALSAAPDGVARLGETVGLSRDRAEAVAGFVAYRLQVMPIEDLRIDFEDGYGAVSEKQEDADAIAAGRTAAILLANDLAPMRVGLRCRAFETSTWRRAVRTLELFLGAAVAEGAWPENLRVTLPKTAHPEQVAALDCVLEDIETANGLERRSLGVELQIELPHLLVPGLQRPSISDAILAGQGRVTALHYGTYDFSAALGVAPHEQRATHPVAAHARRQMQLAAAVHGVEVSDGSTNQLPRGSWEERLSGWREHVRIVRCALQEGFPQGWDLHPAQLLTRHIVTIDSLLSALPHAVNRLRRAASLHESSVAEEPATLRPLARTALSAYRANLLTTQELIDRTSLTVPALENLAMTGTMSA